MKNKILMQLMELYNTNLMDGKHCKRRWMGPFTAAFEQCPISICPIKQVENMSYIFWLVLFFFKHAGRPVVVNMAISLIIKLIILKSELL